jgi:hypothetical protein
MNPQSDGDCPADQKGHWLAPSGDAYRARCLRMNDLDFCGLHDACEAEQWSPGHTSIVEMIRRTNDP